MVSIRLWLLFRAIIQLGQSKVGRRRRKPRTVVITDHASERMEERLGVLGIQQQHVAKIAWSIGTQNKGFQHNKLYLNHNWVFKLAGPNHVKLVTVIPSKKKKRKK